MKNYLEEWMAENFVKIGVPFVFDGIDGKFYIDLNPEKGKYTLYVKNTENDSQCKMIKGLKAILDGKKPIYEDDDIKCPICGRSMSMYYRGGFYHAECDACGMRSREYSNVDTLKKWSDWIKEIIEKRYNNENNSVSTTIMEQVANILGVKMDKFFAVKRSENGLMVRTFKLDKYGLKNEFGEYNHFALNMLLNGDYEVVR